MVRELNISLIAGRLAVSEINSKEKTKETHEKRSSRRSARYLLSLWQQATDRRSSHLLWHWRPDKIGRIWHESTSVCRLSP